MYNKDKSTPELSSVSVVIVVFDRTIGDDCHLLLQCIKNNAKSNIVPKLTPV